MQYTEEQIARANQTDLVSFLNAQGEQLVKSGREYRWKKHDSVRYQEIAGIVIARIRVAIRWIL